MSPAVIREVKPLTMKDVELVLGDPSTGDDFRKHADSITLTPSSSTRTWTGLGTNTHTDVDTATWTVVISYVQDWESDESLSRFLFENEGETIAYTFRPKSGVGPSFKGELVVTPGAIGGQVNSFATTSVTLGATGRPELLPAA